MGCITHVADSAHSSADHLSFGNVDCQPQIGYSDVAVIVEQNVLRFAVSIDDPLCVQMFQAA